MQSYPEMLGWSQLCLKLTSPQKASHNSPEPRKCWSENPIICAKSAKSLQSCLTLCDPIDGSLPGSPVPRILQARTLEWVAISFSNAWKWKVKAKSLSRVRLFATPQTAAHQAPLSMGFSRQEYWSGVPLPSPFLRTDILHKFYSLLISFLILAITIL